MSFLFDRRMPICYHGLVKLLNNIRRVYDMSGIEKLNKKVQNLFSNFDGETTYEDIEYELSSAVKTMFKFTYGEIQEYLSQKGTQDKPVILLSDEIYRGFAYYDKKTKEIVVLSTYFRKALYRKLSAGQSPSKIVETLNAKMLFALLHEIGHYVYYKERYNLLRDTLYAIHGLMKKVKLLSLEEIKKDELVKETILSEAKKTVSSERYADNFAFEELKQYFPATYELLATKSFFKAKERGYAVYAEDKIRQLIQLTCLSIDRQDKAELRKYYNEFIRLEELV